MDEERGLLDAIAEQPDNDGLRGVYADWLEDHGDSARAEFVRLQLALARIGDDHPDRAALLTREFGLLLKHEHAWSLPLGRLCESKTFRRGFIEEVVIQRPLKAKQFDELFAHPFVRRISAPRQAWRLFPGLIESEGAARLEELHIAGTPLEWRQTRDLFAGPRFARLHRLELIDCRLGATAMQQLRRSPMLGRLRTLILRQNPLGEDGILQLLRSPDIGNLRHLDLSECGADGTVLREIATLSMLGGLTTLHLNNALSDTVALAAFFASPRMNHLTDLDLRFGIHVQPDAWNPLLAGDTPTPLRRLALRRNHFSRSQFFELLASPRLAGLCELDLSACEIEEDGHSWIGPHETPTTPLDLDIGGLSCEVATLHELFAAAPALRRVVRLRMQFLGGDPAIFAAVLAAPHLSNLRHLDLGCCPMNAELLDALARSELARRLAWLDLSHCYLHDDEAEQLADFPQLANLTRLSLRNNRIGSRGATALAHSPHLRNLQFLDLGNNRIEDDGAGNLARAEHLGGPVALNVAGNRISGEGMAVLLGAAARAFERGVTIPHLDA